MTINNVNRVVDSVTEQAVIGSILIQEKWAITAVSMLKAKDFSTIQHRTIFSAVEKILNEKKQLDVLTVWDAIKDKSLFDEYGGHKYLVQLQNDLPPVNNLEPSIKKVKHLSLLRDIIDVSQIAILKAQDPSADSVRVLDDAQVALTNLAKTGSPVKITDVKDVLSATTSIMNKVRKNEKYVVGFPTGFMDVDEMTSGLQPGNFMIIAGRPSMGKTAFALNMAQKMARDHNLPSLFVSLEMGKSEIGFRLLSTESKLDLKSIKRGMLKEPQWAHLEKSVTKLNDSPLYFDFSTSPDISDIRATSRKWMYEMQKIKQRLSVIFVDYIQLISSRPMGNREQEISYISRSLKSLARELEVPVVALSQLNRKPEERGRNGIPQLADLRESGALEQDADVVCALYRPIVYTKDENHRGIAKLIVMKQRNGPIGDIPLTFNESCATFESTHKKVDYEI